ncbi:hypothetical protein RUM43_008573 [Polyplax serrata]|uniref:Uncharacterized protein n=1 Tax=Polyplax serrata TaxID=468196 RepID=A0AAN8S3Y0_POLSC
MKKKAAKLKKGPEVVLLQHPTVAAAASAATTEREKQMLTGTQKETDISRRDLQRRKVFYSLQREASEGEGKETKASGSYSNFTLFRRHLNCI